MQAIHGARCRDRATSKTLSFNKSQDVAFSVFDALANTECEAGRLMHTRRDCVCVCCARRAESGDVPKNCWVARLRLQNEAAHDGEAGKFLINAVAMLDTHLVHRRSRARRIPSQARKRNGDEESGRGSIQQRRCWATKTGEKTVAMQKRCANDVMQNMMRMIVLCCADCEWLWRQQSGRVRVCCRC